ncbi:MAG: sigma-70 family RNA polymerase sigma factor [bacterium]|nr:sigma-70 family RNA polymerase sigma factor [bacterium]
MQNGTKLYSLKGVNEDQWVKDSQAGDAEAFRNLYQRYYGQISAFCSRMLQGRPDTEDAVQQVFLEAWRSLHRFEGRSLFSTWITKIAIHICLSFHRKSSRLLLAIDAEHDPIVQATEVCWGKKVLTPEEQLWTSMRRKAVIRIINKMSKKKQTVFILSDMQGMTAPEISSILGIPDATVRTRLFHARKDFINAVNRSPYYKNMFEEDTAKQQKSA